MANVTLRSNALYCGPGTNYAGAATGVYGKSAEVLWKEDTYYYVRLTSPRVQGYIFCNNVTIPSGTSVRTFTPSHGEARYVAASETAYLGPGTAYQEISAPNRAQMVDYLGEKENNYAFIEYELAGYNNKKFRSWFPANSLNYNEASDLTADEYKRRVTDDVSPYDYPSYVDGNGEIVTLCNHYAYYAMDACETPLFVRESDGAPAVCSALFDTLSTNTFKKWRIIDTDKAYEEAQARANNGYPTLALEPKHVAVVVPNGNTIPTSKSGVKISQAGKTLFDADENKTISNGWIVNSEEYNNIKFFSWYY